MDQQDNDYTEVTDWVDGHSSDAKPPAHYSATRTRRHTLPAKPVPPPKPKIHKMSSTENPSPATQRKERLPMPLPRSEGNKPLPSIPAVVETELPYNDPAPEEPTKLANVTTKPYSLEAFYKEFQLPQIVSVVGGHLGVTEEYSMSEGEELVLFFVKTSQVVVATPNKKSEWYYVPLNSSLQFVPCQYLPGGDTSVKGEDYFEQYKTVEDLLNRKGELPKVVKVCKAYNGKSSQSSVVAGELIFPKKVSRRKKVLECLNSKKKLLKLELKCEGNFSINPADVKMHLVELLHYFQDFPILAIVINDRVGRSKSCSLSTGTVLSLEEPKQLQTYICSTDISGKMNYPLMELPISMPIEIQCIEYPDFDMNPVYGKIQRTYENFKPSLISKNLFNARSTSMLATQQALYEEIEHHDRNTDMYDLEKPSLIYDSIPTQFSCSEDAVDQDFHPTPTSSSLIDTFPPLLSPKDNTIDTRPPLPPPRDSPLVTAKKLSVSSASHSSPVPPKPPTESGDNVIPCEKPSLIYDSIPTQFSCSEDAVDQDFHPTPTSSSLVDTLPPLPSPRDNTIDTRPPLLPPRDNPSVTAENLSVSSASHSSPVPPNLPTESGDNVIPCYAEVSLNPISSSGSNEKPTVEKAPLQPRDGPPVTAESSRFISSHNTTPTGATENIMNTISYVGGSNKEENIAYLKTFNIDKLLQLLENMNLGQYKESFEDQQIDGEMIIHLERADLVDLGVNKNIHQTRLLKLIDGSVSAKKYDGGGYGTLKRKQSVP